MGRVADMTQQRKAALEDNRIDAVLTLDAAAARLNIEVEAADRQDGRLCATNPQRPRNLTIGYAWLQLLNALHDCLTLLKAVPGRVGQ